MDDAKEFDFSLFTDRQLFHLCRQVNREIARRRLKEQTLPRRYGELIEGARPRYQNPENLSETWSGRGTAPGWVHDALARGTPLTDLAVGNDDRPIRRRRVRRRR